MSLALQDFGPRVLDPDDFASIVVPSEKVSVIGSGEAHTFLDLLRSGERDQLTFQTFDDSSQHRRQLSKIFHGELSQHQGALARLNTEGAGIFVMVNCGDGLGRKATNVERVRAYFADVDGAPLAPVLESTLPPNIVIESSPQRFHAYWLVTDSPPDQFKRVQHAIATRFDSDPSVCDLPRVMRVPGFVHCKAAPFRSRIVQRCRSQPYTHFELTEWLGIGAVGTSAQRARPMARELPAVVPKGTRNTTLFNLAAGFVRRGHSCQAITDRMHKINLERCQPPLPAREVEVIAANASAQGSKGFIKLSHALLDSPEWGRLTPECCAIVLAFYRRYDGFNNGRLAVPWEGSEGCHGMSKNRFYKHLRQALAEGVLVQTLADRNSQTGRTPAFYRIPDHFISPVRKIDTGADTQNDALK